jgi:hypothetical protein
MFICSSVVVGVELHERGGRRAADHPDGQSLEHASTGRPERRLRSGEERERADRGREPEQGHEAPSNAIPQPPNTIRAGTSKTAYAAKIPVPAYQQKRSSKRPAARVCGYLAGALRVSCWELRERTTEDLRRLRA